MAIASYLMRREGRYSLQIRQSRFLVSIIGRPLYRASLMTSDYGVAKTRLVGCLLWFHPMNNARDNDDLYFEIQRRVDDYLLDTMPIDQDRLIARQKFDEWKSSALEAQAAKGIWNRYLFDDELQEKVRLFQLQNAEAEKYLRKGEVVRAYERGRADMYDAAIFGALSAPVAAGARPAETHLNGAGTLNPLFEAARSLTLHSETSTSDSTPKALTHIRTSEALERYTVDSRLQGKSEDGLSTVRLIVQFLIDEFDDPVLANLSSIEIEQLDKMMADIPNRQNIPRASASTLSLRYRYAKDRGWADLVRLTGETLKKGYHSALSKFFGWAIQKGHFSGEKPVFKFVSGDNLTSLPRDSFRADEVIEIISMPLFKGCDGSARIWKTGTCFIQNHLYWSYIILLLTGLRTGEMGQLRISDFAERDGIWYLNLRGFDPSKGRVALKDVTHFKTKNSARMVPLHPLILDLGFLDRLKELEAMGCDFAFPEWEPYFKPGGELRWGQPMTKSWAYMKTKTSIVRKDVTLYSTRHFFADLVDNKGLTERARKLLMGHSNKSDMSARYGSKTRLTTRDLKELGAEDPIIDQMSVILLAAKERAEQGELTVYKPWLNRASWSEYYRQKIDGLPELPR